MPVCLLINNKWPFRIRFAELHGNLPKHLFSLTFTLEWGWASPKTERMEFNKGNNIYV